MLLQRMQAMSAADISVLDASVKTPDSNMTTAPGSKNDLLWSGMEILGWMRTRNEELELPGGRRFAMKIYTITPDGVEPIANLLAALSQGQKNSGG